LQGVEKLDTVDHELHERSVAELRDESEYILQLTTLNPVSGPVAAEQPVRRKQP